MSPREFIVTPDGNWIISAHQTSNTLTSLRRDLVTGALTMTPHTCEIGSPAALIATWGQDLFILRLRTASDKQPILQVGGASFQ